MQKQFWNNEKTEASLKTLHLLAGKIDFVLIGGWAVYFYTNAQRSEDVDIAIGISGLDFFRGYGIQDYGGINIKYSIVGDTVVDLFIQEYADRDLPVPVKDILENYTLFEGNIKTVNREMLLLLKLWGYFREDEAKLRKDMIDVINLILYGGIDLKKFGVLLKKYKIAKRRGKDVLLEYLDKGETLLDYIGMDNDKYRREKNALKKRIKEMQ